MKIIEVTYLEWKTLLGTRPHYFGVNVDSYKLYAGNRGIVFYCDLDLDDVADYETNYKPQANTVSPETNENDAFASKQGHSFRGMGFSGNALKNASTVIALTVDNTYDLSGVEILNGALGDKVQMKVVDDALGTYSTIPNYVLDQFGINWNIRPNFVKDLPYTARVYLGMKVEFHYTNSDILNDRMIYINLDLHRVV